MNVDLLKQAGGNYFDELLAKLEIFVALKIILAISFVIYTLSIDYDPRIETSILFFRKRFEIKCTGQLMVILLRR